MLILAIQHHRWKKIVRVVVLVVTGNIETGLQRLQWLINQSSWRHFRFCNVIHKRTRRIRFFFSFFERPFLQYIMRESIFFFHLTRIAVYGSRRAKKGVNSVLPNDWDKGGFDTPNYIDIKVKWSLQWRHNGCDTVSNHQPHDCLLNRLFRCRSKKASKLRVTGLCAGNSPEIGEFPAQMASNAENVSIWWRHHGWPWTYCYMNCEHRFNAHSHLCITHAINYYLTDLRIRIIAFFPFCCRFTVHVSFWCHYRLMILVVLPANHITSMNSCYMTHV